MKKKPKRQLRKGSALAYNKAMKIDVSHVAKLANLPLTDHETAKFAKQLSAILDYIKRLDEVDVKNVEPTSQVTGLENVSRGDETQPSLSQNDALSNAQSKSNGFFVVKGIFNE